MTLKTEKKKRYFHLKCIFSAYLNKDKDKHVLNGQDTKPPSLCDFCDSLSLVISRNFSNKKKKKKGDN